MISERRMLLEKQALDYGFLERYRLYHEDTPAAHLTLGLYVGNAYLIRINLRGFSYNSPEVYVVNPKVVVHLRNIVTQLDSF